MKKFFFNSQKFNLLDFNPFHINNQFIYKTKIKHCKIAVLVILLITTNTIMYII